MADQTSKPPVVPPPPPPFLPPDEELRQNLESQQVNIQMFLIVTFSIYAGILMLGRLRARGNKIMRLCSTYSFMITAYLVTYIPGIMSEPGQSNDLYVFWVAFIAYLAAITNEISCYSIGDNEDRKKRLIVDYAIVWPLIFNFLYKTLASPEILVPIAIIFWIIALKLRERNSALLYATKSTGGLYRATKIISDFAKYQNDQYHPDLEGKIPRTALLGVKEANQSVVEQKERGSRVVDYGAFGVITLNKVLLSEEAFLVGTGAGRELRDNSTSFAMFWTLLAKIAGCADVDAKVFFDAKQLPENCFALVEKELDFLYDYFFTNYYAIYEKGIWKKMRDLGVITIFFWLAIPLLVEYRPQDHNILYIVWNGHVLDTAFTRVVIIAIIAMEFIQIGVFLTSKWAKVMYTCTYIQNQNVWGSTRQTKSKVVEWLIERACSVPRPRLSLFCLSTFTQRKVGQYSIVDCYGEIPAPVWCECWIGTYVDLPRVGQAGKWNKIVPHHVKQSIAETINYSLREWHSKISSGVLSLEKNGVGQGVIDTYVKKATIQARTILIWHIATCYCEEGRGRRSPNPYSVNDFERATVLSKYCAYLVGFLPQILQDQVYTTQCEFDEAIRELKHEASHDGDEELEGWSGDDNTILGQARALQGELQKQEGNMWRTLAEFWTEMVLFLALADSGAAVDAHVDTLCVGGEFLTHIWALLTHAGCSKIIYPTSILHPPPPSSSSLSGMEEHQHRVSQNTVIKGSGYEP